MCKQTLIYRLTRSFTLSVFAVAYAFSVISVAEATQEAEGSKSKDLINQKQAEESSILARAVKLAKEKRIEKTAPNSPVTKDDFEWLFVVDLSLNKSQTILKDVEQTQSWDYLQLGLLLDVYYKGFFLQTNSRRSLASIDGGELGYQIVVRDDWQLDVLIKTYIEGFEAEKIIEHQESAIPQLTGLDDRGSTGGLALRYSHFFEHSIFFVDVAAARAIDINDGEDDYASGLIIDSFYSYLLPYRNWDIYFGAGLTFYQQALIDYYIGVDADEVSAVRPLFEADSSYRAQLEVYAQYPLSSHWSFNAGITQSFYSKNIKRSPLVDKSSLTQFMAGVKYVF